MYHDYIEGVPRIHDAAAWDSTLPVNLLLSSVAHPTQPALRVSPVRHRSRERSEHLFAGHTDGLTQNAVLPAYRWMTTSLRVFWRGCKVNWFGRSSKRFRCGSPDIRVQIEIRGKLSLPLPETPLPIKSEVSEANEVWYRAMIIGTLPVGAACSVRLSE